MMKLPCLNAPLYTTRHMKQGVVGAVLTLLAIGGIVAPVRAQTPTEGINLQISPLPIALNVTPGSSAVTNLRVRNAGTEPDRLALHILKVSEDDNGRVSLTEPTAADDWVHWISFPYTTFDAPAGEWQTIPMTIRVPNGAAFGYYFAVEYMRASQEIPQGGQTAANGAVATFVLLNAEAPGAVRSAQIVSFTADRSVYEFLPATFTVKIRASGNVHVAPHGNIFIMSGNKQIDSIEINAAAGNILPQSSRFFSAAWNNGFPHYVPKLGPDGQPLTNSLSQTETTLSWDFSQANRLRFGHYTAQLEMVYDDGQRDVPLAASVSFWIVPWRLVGAVLGLVALFLFLTIYIGVLHHRLRNITMFSRHRD